MIVSKNEKIQVVDQLFLSSTLEEIFYMCVRASPSTFDLQQRRGVLHNLHCVVKECIHGPYDICHKS